MFSETDRRFVRVQDALELIDHPVPGHFGFGCTDRRPLLAATIKFHKELSAAGFKPSTGEVLNPDALPVRYCTDCGVQLKAYRRDIFGVLSPSTFPRCSQHAF